MLPSNSSITSCRHGSQSGAFNVHDCVVLVSSNALPRPLFLPPCLRLSKKSRPEISPIPNPHLPVVPSQQSSAMSRPDTLAGMTNCDPSAHRRGLHHPPNCLHAHARPLPVIPTPILGAVRPAYHYVLRFSRSSSSKVTCLALSCLCYPPIPNFFIPPHLSFIRILSSFPGILKVSREDCWSIFHLHIGPSCVSPSCWSWSGFCCFGGLRNSSPTVQRPRLSGESFSCPRAILLPSSFSH